MVNPFKTYRQKIENGVFLLMLAALLIGMWPSVSPAQDSLLLDWPTNPHPQNWQMRGYAFGTRTPHPEKRQQAAIPTRNQQQYQTGELISPEFVLNTDFLQVRCSGVYHPSRCAVQLIIKDENVRSCSPEPSSGFKGEGQRPATYWFDLRPLLGERARIKVVDFHKNGFLDSVRIVATNQKPPKEAKIVETPASWLPDFYESRINENYLLLPVGPLAGTPLQAVTVEIAGHTKLTTDVPLAFGAIPVAGYLPVYDLTGYQGETLKVSFHSYNGYKPDHPSAKILVQRDIPARRISDSAPVLHIYPRLGQLNDPNGLVYINGTYHLFHQYKYNITACSWAHYVSTDLMHWQERPIALFPDEMGSKHSGSAVVDVLNTLGWQRGEIPPVIAAYTASRGIGGKDKIQMQCLAYSTDNARTFTTYDGNPIIGEEEIWAKGSSNNRDPKIFWYSPTRGLDPYAKDGHWVLVLYQRRDGKNGHTIYTSDNLRDWTEQSRVIGLRECPDLFPLAIDGDPNQVRWILHGSKGDYFIGFFDGKVFKPQIDTKLPMFYRDDMSTRSDLYAAQTFNNTPTGDGGQPRRIQVAWFREGNQLSLPTELQLRTTPLGLRLCQLPAKEISLPYTHSNTFDGLSLYPDTANPLADINGGLYDIDLQADLSGTRQLSLNVRGVPLVIKATATGLSLDGMTIPDTKQATLRVIVDNTFIEVFFGEFGLYRYPIRYVPSSQKITINVPNGKAVFEKLQVHELESIWEIK